MAIWKWYKHSYKTDHNWESGINRHNASVRFGVLEFYIHKNAEFEQEMTSLEESIDRDR